MIFFDGVIFRFSPHAGISRIFRELWERWVKVNANGTVFIPPEVELSNQDRLARINYSGLKPRRFFWRWELSRAYHQVKPDLFISTFYTLSPDETSKEIAVFPDMIDEIYYDLPWSDHSLISRKKELADRSTVIIAISNKTKEDILSFYKDLPESRVKVIPLAAAEIFKPISRTGTAGQVLSKPFILYVGGRRNYKNFITLLSVYASNSKINRVYDLVVIDKKPWYKDEIELINTSGLYSRIHLMLDVSDQDLVRYYQQARVFVFPSKYEGFGIPLLEATACGTPVIANSSASLVEIGENAVLYFSGPDEQSSLSIQLEKICFDDALYLEYSNKGLKQSAKFSWDKFVQQFNELVCTS